MGKVYLICGTKVIPHCDQMCRLCGVLEWQHIPQQRRRLGPTRPVQARKGASSYIHLLTKLDFRLKQHFSRPINCNTLATRIIVIANADTVQLVYKFFMCRQSQESAAATGRWSLLHQPSNDVLNASGVCDWWMVLLVLEAGFHACGV